MKELDVLSSISGKLVAHEMRVPKPLDTMCTLDEDIINNTKITFTIEIDDPFHTKKQRFTTSGDLARVIAPHIMNEGLQLSDTVRIGYNIKERTKNGEREITMIGWENDKGVKFIKK